MSRNGKKPLKKILFRYYFGNVCLFTSLLFFLAVIFIVNDRRIKIEELQTNLCETMSNSIASSMEKMSTVSMNVIYSPTIQMELKNKMAEDVDIRMRERIYNAIASIIGPSTTVTQVDIHSADGYKVGWGIYELFAEENYQELENYSEIIEKDGRPFYGMPEYRKDLSYYNRYLKDKQFISLYRLFRGDYFKEKGIVEVIQKCDVFFEQINNLQDENNEFELVVLNEKKEMIYPYFEIPEEKKASVSDIMEQIKEKADHSKKCYIHKGKLISYEVLKKSGWTVAVSQSVGKAYGTIGLFIMLYLCIVSLFIGILAYIGYRTADKIAEPINKLKENIENIDLNNIMDNQYEMEKIEADAVEIDMLSREYREMYDRLEVSTKELMNSRMEEFRAKMTATQSMLNPHFVFNNLANISIMAEENMNDEIIVLCKNLCDYMRYIGADSLEIVDLETELLYTKKYLDCMKVRYRTRLTCEFDVAPEIQKLPISKLTLQPIIENALKYAFRVPPPWRVCVTGRRSRAGYEIIVEDNGSGIKEEYRTEIIENFRKIKENKDISEMKIGGMGLANVYLRLLLLYGDEAQLLIENRAEGGTKVTIVLPDKPAENKGKRKDGPKV